MKTATIAFGAFAVVLGVATAAPVAAEPVSAVHSESPFIENFFREVDGLGYGYLDPAWKVSDAAWIACGVREAPGGTYYDAVAVVGGRGYSNAEATSIVDSATRHLCN